MSAADLTSVVDLTSAVDLVARRQQLKAEIADRERDVKELDERIKAAWGDADEAFVVVAGERQPIGTWQEVTSRVLDQGYLRSAYPQVRDACMTERTTRAFRLTWEPPTIPQRWVTGIDQTSTEPRYSEWDDL